MTRENRTAPTGRRWLAALAAAALPLTLAAGPASAAPPAHAGPPGASEPGGGFTVTDQGRIADANGDDVLLRGLSYPHTWYSHTYDPAEQFAAIASTGANAVRVVLSNGRQGYGYDDVDSVTEVVDACIANQLVCVLEVHDTTGYGDEWASPDASTLAEAVDWWLEVQPALEGREDVVIVNIGNEPFGNQPEVGEVWAAETSEAIQRLRAAGFDHLLMVDAPNWGQDWSWTMFEQADEVFAADPHRNTVFSIHMYGVYADAARITTYLEGFVERQLPLVVGEFGHDHSDGNPDEDAILAETRRLGLGWIAWSWSGNSGGVEYLDLVEDFDVTTPTWWGQRVFTGPDGFAETARTIGVFARPERAADCRNRNWSTYRYPAFPNQGQCVAYVATGRGRG
ncbi:glycoside hydrolase family 5 protein [Egicoccus halophilus]|uniref:Beta-mannosidase n=1 Tax=Egicoccus halophilus TaxID=1670830 RepID=A0A8J3AFG8_9ACTN|nr:glycoside hydrolase family 5 protein [Egicoccus halophilus]GGI07958.1 beta-mannosidase [Egicoccus halophilus]